MKKLDYEIGEATVVEIPPGVKALIRARELISDPKRWTQGAFARTASSRALDDVHDACAIKFCSIGAFHKAGGDEYSVDLLTGAALELFGRPVVSVNDYGERHEAHPRVLKIFDLAIEKAMKDRR